MSVGLFAAGVVLLVHNQIEMTFFQGGSVAIAWVIPGSGRGGGMSAHCPSPFGRGWRVPTPGEGVANPRSRPRRVSVRGSTKNTGHAQQENAHILSLLVLHALIRPEYRPPSLPEGEEQYAQTSCLSRRLPWIPGLVILLILAPAMVWGYATVIRPANPADRAADLRAATRDPQALDALTQAIAVLPRDIQPYRWFAQISGDLAFQMAGMGRQSDALAALDRAFALPDCVREICVDRALCCMTAQLQNAGHISGDQSAIQPRADARFQVSTTRPYRLPDTLALADLLWDMGRRDGANIGSLPLDDQSYLDTLTQLTEPEHELASGNESSKWTK